MDGKKELKKKQMFDQDRKRDTETGQNVLYVQDVLQEAVENLPA